MTSSNINIKLLCEEYLNSNNKDQILKLLNKLLGILKISEKMQKEIYVLLSDKGITKLLNSISDINTEIRKSSCKVLLEMLNNNELLQNIFCEKFNFNPVGNVICINWLPKYLKENLKIDEKVINEIKNYNCASGLKYWMWPENSKYSDDILPDPQRYLIGFYYAYKNSHFTINDDKQVDEKVDIRLLTTKLENENFEDNKAAGSGGESTSKINENLKEKYTNTVEPSNLESVNANVNYLINMNVKHNIVSEVNNMTDKSKIGIHTNNITDKKGSDTKKIKEDYKKNIKEKGYSKSIDNNGPKKNAGIITISNNNNFHGANNNNADTISNRIKINKTKK